MTDVFEQEEQLFGASFVIFVHKYRNLILILIPNDKNNASNVFCIHENPKKEVLHKFL